MLYVAPLWPAGHLPRKEGDQADARFPPNFSDASEAARPKLLISTLAGEMAGRPEGGATAHELRHQGAIPQ
jgi:hypothetical protein